MTIAITLITILAAGIMLVILIQKRKSAKEVKLQSRFDSIGIMHGLTKEEVISRVGPPGFITTLGTDGEILQWREGGFDIVIFFDRDEKFSCITFKTPYIKVSNKV